MRRTVENPQGVQGSVRTTVKPSPADAEKPREKEGYRETVEAIVVAMILALLVRGFEAEAFVIPTGSMAPTLMGRHKEITCKQCGYVYAINASDEVEGPSRSLGEQPRVSSGICVNCRYRASVDDAPSFKGDRILVMKFPYDLPNLPGASPPERWDVVVFRYPEKPEVSYIKRLVGLSDEVLKIYFGDIYIKPPGATDFHLERKPLHHQRAMQMMVYDDTHRARALLDRPEWRRWQAKSGWREEAPEPAGPWRFVGEATSDWSELRYRHLVPDPEQWKAILNDGSSSIAPPYPTLITDFYSYNTNVLKVKIRESRQVMIDGDLKQVVEFRDVEHDQDAPWLQPHWVGDLTLSADLNVKAPVGSVRFELIEGGIANRCEIDLATGLAVLYHGDRKLGEQPSEIRGPGQYAIEFANVDDRLTLLVDGRTPFGAGLTYDVEEPHRAPSAADLAPAAIAARGAQVEVSGLVLKRDIYYTQNPGQSDYGQSWQLRTPRTPADLYKLLSDTEQFPLLGDLKSHEYPIGTDRFMMLGDNSPRSADSRGWDNRDRFDPDYPGSDGWDTSGRASWEVPRALITGKAFFVYWPHGKPFGPDLRWGPDFRLLFRPYIERMKWIR
jgi:signal peptidase I